jgi:Lrp/AsnC family leucine-responsive transcriptional regulator
MSALDDTDRRLLRVLQADGRITNAELAKRCNLSPAATFDRVRRLRERGFITGYAALLECHMVAGGFDYLIKARVRDMEAYRNFLGDILVKMPGVRETRTYAVLEEVKSTVQLPL